MGWVGDLRGEVVSLDTAPLIYFVEENQTYIDMLAPFFDAVNKGEILVVTSILTLVETMVHPFRDNNAKLINDYQEILFNTKGLKTVAFSQDIAEEAAWLRALYKIRTPDAIQMATASSSGASVFLTNDIRLPSTSKLKVLALDKLRSL